MDSSTCAQERPASSIELALDRLGSLVEKNRELIITAEDRLGFITRPPEPLADKNSTCKEPEAPSRFLSRIQGYCNGLDGTNAQIDDLLGRLQI